jgi:hypothetical protein
MALAAVKMPEIPCNLLSIPTTVEIHFATSGKATLISEATAKGWKSPSPEHLAAPPKLGSEIDPLRELREALEAS